MSSGIYVIRNLVNDKLYVGAKTWNFISHKKIPTDHKADGDNCLFWHSRLSSLWVKIKFFTVE